MKTFNEWLENFNNNELVNALKQLANEINQIQANSFGNSGHAYPILWDGWKSSNAVGSAKKYSNLSPNAEQEFQKLSNFSIMADPQSFQHSKTVCLQQIEKVIQACQEAGKQRRTVFDDDE